jgi:hypothetical protein
MNRKAVGRRVVRLDDQALMECRALDHVARSSTPLSPPTSLHRSSPSVALRRCRTDGAAVHRLPLVRGTVVDCAIIDSNLSAAVLELVPKGRRVDNMQPGFIANERRAHDMGTLGFDATLGVAPEIIGAVLTWLVTDPGRKPKGRILEAEVVCKELGLLPGWLA